MKWLALLALAALTSCGSLLGSHDAIIEVDTYDASTKSQAAPTHVDGVTIRALRGSDEVDKIENATCPCRIDLDSGTSVELHVTAPGRAEVVVPVTVQKRNTGDYALVDVPATVWL